MKTSMFTGGFLAFLGRVPSAGGDGTAAETAPTADVSGSVPFLPMLLQMLQPAPQRSSAEVTNGGAGAEGEEASSDAAAGNDTAPSSETKEAEVSLLRLALSRPRVRTERGIDEQPPETGHEPESVPAEAEAQLHENAGATGTVPAVRMAVPVAAEIVTNEPPPSLPVAYAPAVGVMVSGPRETNIDAGSPVKKPVQPAAVKQMVNSMSVAAEHRQASHTAAPVPVNHADDAPLREAANENVRHSGSGPRSATPEPRPLSGTVKVEPTTVPPAQDHAIAVERSEAAPRHQTIETVPPLKDVMSFTSAPPVADVPQTVKSDAEPTRESGMRSSGPTLRGAGTKNGAHDAAEEIPAQSVKEGDAPVAERTTSENGQRRTVNEAEAGIRTLTAPPPEPSVPERPEEHTGKMKEPVSSAPNAEKPADERSFSGEQERPAHRERTIDRTVAPASNDDRPPLAPAGLKGTARVAAPAARWEPETVRSVMHQLARGVVSAVDTEHSTMKVVLHPESLGEVTVKVLVDDGKVSATMDVQQSQVKSLIEANMPQLRDALQQKGLTVERIEILAAEKGTADEAGRRQQERGQRRSRREDDDAPADAAAAKRFGYNTVEYTM